MSDIGNRGERLQIMLTDEELRMIDDWRFSRRMPSRASAVRELLRRGLTAEGFLESEQGMRSKDYGIGEMAAFDGEDLGGRGADPARGARPAAPSPRCAASRRRPLCSARSASAG